MAGDMLSMIAGPLIHHGSLLPYGSLIDCGSLIFHGSKKVAPDAGVEIRRPQLIQGNGAYSLDDCKHAFRF
jgi:hypothetical protein